MLLTSLSGKASIFTLTVYLNIVMAFYKKNNNPIFVETSRSIRASYRC